MAIKVGDIVEYMGVRQRVMGIYRDGTVSLSKQSLFTFQPLKALTLVESVQLPVIKPGDIVTVKDLPMDEAWFAYPKSIHYALYKVDLNQPMVVEDVLDDDMFGPRAQMRIDDVLYSFYLYCLEKVNHYDMI